MAASQTGIPLAEGLSYTLDSTKEHPERFLALLGGEKPLPLSKVQALALFKLLLNSLGQIAGEDLSTDPLLSQVSLVQGFHDSLEWLEDWSHTELTGKPGLLQEAYEQYQFTCEFQEEMLDAAQGWETVLERQGDKLETAAEALGIDLDELDEEEELEAYELHDDEPNDYPDET